jgi:hypothetical protein
LVLAFFATIVHLFHRADRQYLKLKHEPGTIASAVSLCAQTGVGDVLAGHHAEGDIEEALRNKKFRINPATMKIIMEGEDGYETAAIPPSPFYKRKSILDLLSGSGANRRLSRNPFGAGVTPTTPSSPSFLQPQTPQNARTLPSPPGSGGSSLYSTVLSWTPLDFGQLPNGTGTTADQDTSSRITHSTETHMMVYL